MLVDNLLNVNKILGMHMIFILIFLGNVVWLDDRMPTKALLELTRPIRELKHLTSVVEDNLNDEARELNDNSNDDHMDQDDVS
jgi:hypothetical protein